jgi:response regulator RpfG family c-di-GMP phosphodiesterase
VRGFWCSGFRGESNGDVTYEYLVSFDSRTWWMIVSEIGALREIFSYKRGPMRDLHGNAAISELMNALERKGMRGHAERTATIAQAIAAAMKLAPDSMRTCVLGGLLREVGKLDVPDRILFNPGKLNEEEIAVMRTYSYLVYERVRTLPACACAASIVYAHRELFDGSGYARCLKGEEIPLGARIVAVACAFVTFVSDRPHDVSRALDSARLQVRDGRVQLLIPQWWRFL